MTNADRTDAEEISPKRSKLATTIHSFVVIPLIIAFAVFIILFFFRLFTTEEKTIYNYLNEVKTSRSHQSWQAAYELSKHLLNSKSASQIHEKRFIDEMVSTFNQFGEDDKRIKQYLALAMGSSGDKRFVEPLLAAMPGEEGDSLVAIIHALGLLKDRKSAPRLYNYLKNPSSKVRLSVVIALGNIGDTASAEVLKEALKDSEPNVVWDASVALAKLGRPEGKGVLLKLLDRAYLSQFKEVDAEEQDKILITAIEAAILISDADFTAAIGRLRDNDPNPKIRAASMKALTQRAH